jgi:hypothetical protein
MRDLGGGWLTETPSGGLQVLGLRWRRLLGQAQARRRQSGAVPNATAYIPTRMTIHSVPARGSRSSTTPRNTEAAPAMPNGHRSAGA